MSILVNKNTRVICQGITGSVGCVPHTRLFEYGTQMVGVSHLEKGARQQKACPFLIRSLKHGVRLVATRQ